MADIPLSPPKVPPRSRRLGQFMGRELPQYYHSCVKNLDEVKQLMVKYVGKEGAFIIRESFSRPGSFTASVMHGEGIKHFNIVRNGAYFFVQDERFNSLEDVVNYFSEHEVPNQEGVKHVKLRYPITCNTCRRGSNVSTPVSTRSQTLGRSTSDLSSNLTFDLGHSASSATLPLNLRLDNASTTSDDSSAVIGLPSPPSGKTPSPGKKRFSNIFNFRHKNHGIQKTEKSKRLVKSESDPCNVDISKRPPCPLPSSTHQDKAAYDYEEVRNTEVSRLPELMKMLITSSEHGMEKCECGLTIDESELPGGWSMHISHDENTRGRLFFMGPRGETSWNMPLEVSLDLCADDQDRIRQVKAKCEELQQQYRQALAAGQQAGAMGESSISTGSFSNSTSFSPNTSGFRDSGGQQMRYFPEDGASGGSMAASSRAHPTQHNEYTGSTAGMSPGISSASMPIPSQGL